MNSSLAMRCGAYDLLSSGKSQMGVILQYPSGAPNTESSIPITRPHTQSGSSPAGKAVVGAIGAGGFAKGVLLPAFAKTGAKLHSIASAGGLNAAHAARKFGFENCSSDYRTMLDDSTINTVVITTRHNLHAPMVIEALHAGKHVFVEKPVAINREELQEVRDGFEQTSGQQLMVGFNRRFSPHIEKAKQLLGGRTQPLCMSMLINAGQIPSDHWIQDPSVGGGRVVGEVCHWIDLLRFLVGSPICSVQSTCFGDQPGVTTRNDHIAINMGFEDGSVGAIQYFSNGHRGFPKEKLTIFSDGRVLDLDNFRALRGHGWTGFSKFKTMRQDKGHQAECQHFVDRIAAGGEALIPCDQLWNVAEATFDADPLLFPQTTLEEVPVEAL